MLRLRERSYEIMYDAKILKKINAIPEFANKQPFAGAFATKPNGRTVSKRIRCTIPGTAKVYDINYILDAVGLKDGMTISFHHALRNGDSVMHYVIDAIAKKGIKNLTLSASSLSLVQDCLLPYFECSVITAVDTTGCRRHIGKFTQAGE